MTDFHPLYEALYRAAVEPLSDAGTASPRFIQRMMNLPYGIAEELFQLMQRDGIVGTVPDARGARAELVRGIRLPTILDRERIGLSWPRSW